MNLKLMGLRCLIKAILDTFYISKKLKKGTWKKSVLGRSILHYVCKKHLAHSSLNIELFMV